MDLDIYRKVLEFIEINPAFARELGGLAEAILLNKTPATFTLSKECKLLSTDEQILKDSEPNDFKATEILHFFYVLDFLTPKVNELKSTAQWVSFFSNLYNPQYNSSYNAIGHKFTDLAVIISNHYFGVNIPEIIINNTESNSRPLRNSYFDTFPFLKAKDQEIIDALFIVTEGIKPEDNYISLNISVRKKAFESPQFAFLLIEKSITNIQKARLFVPFVFVGITEALGIEKTFIILKELLESPDKELKIIGLRSLGMLHGNNVNPKEIEEKALLLLEPIEAAGDDSLLGELLFTYGLLVEKFQYSRQKLIDIPNNNSGKDVFFALARILHLKIEEELNEEWVKVSLVKLSNLFQHHTGTYNSVSWALYDIIKSQPDIAFNYFENFIREKQNSIDDLRAFKNVFSELIQNDFAVFQKWITIWLNNDENRFQQAVTKTLMIVSIDKSKEVRLDEDELNKLHPYDIEFILYKIVGNIFAKENLESLTFSALSFNGENAFIKQVVSELFCYYITYNYPGSLDYLKQKKANSNSLQREVIEVVEQFFAEVYSLRKAKPKELYPSHERLQLLFNQSTKQFANSKDNSRFKEASFLDFVTKVSIKTGNAFFSRDEYTYGMQNRYKNKSNMGHISHSFDFPSGEFLDPIGQEYNRHIWRTFKRRKK